jgi:hypothetical protein
MEAQVMPPAASGANTLNFGFVVNAFPFPVSYPQDLIPFNILI